MTRRLPLLIAAAIIGLTIALAAHAATSHAAPRCLVGKPPFQAPIHACTPGHWTRLTTSQACAAKDRPNLPAADRRSILTRYGLTTWTGAQGELDHLQPFWAGGTTDALNVWPERGPATNNPKDRLENYLRRRVCVLHTMSLATVHRIFATNWVAWYRWYGLGA